MAQADPRTNLRAWLPAGVTALGVALLGACLAAGFYWYVIMWDFVEPGGYRFVALQLAIGLATLGVLIVRLRVQLQALRRSRTGDPHDR